MKCKRCNEEAPDNIAVLFGLQICSKCLIELQKDI